MARYYAEGLHFSAFHYKANYKDCTKRKQTRTGWFVQYIYIYIYMVCIKLGFEAFEDFIAQNVDQGFVQQSENRAWNPWI